MDNRAMTAKARTSADNRAMTAKARTRSAETLAELRHLELEDGEVQALLDALYVVLDNWWLDPPQRRVLERLERLQTVQAGVRQPIRPNV
jgi:hypothetical protein